MSSDSNLAKRAFEPLVAAAKGNARALLALANEALLGGARDRAQELAFEAMAVSPDDPAIAYGVRHLLSRMVPSWHFPMMRDDIRNRAYQEAIERAVRPDMKVLDIGSGSGLLAMIAARAGAREVHSCEMNPAIAKVAADIVRSNGFGDEITIHPRNSAKLDPEADLGGQADLVISEIIGKDLVCEHVLPSLQDAARRLAKPGVQFIPCGGEIRVALAHFATVEDRRVGDVCGFDVSQFNQFAPVRIEVRVDDPRLKLRSAPTTLFAFDFASLEQHQERAALDLVAAGGPVNGVVQWFQLKLDAVGSFENSPGPKSSQSWVLVFFPFSEQLDLEPGETVSVTASVAGNVLRIWKV